MTIKRQRYLPYVYAERALRIELREVRCGEDLIDLELAFDPENRTLDLRDLVDQPEPISLAIEVQGIDDALFETVLPVSERDDPPLRFVAVLIDDAGWYRVVASLMRADAVASGSVEFIPIESTGFANLEVMALRTTASAPDTEPGFATGAGMRVANSPVISLFTRERPETPGGSLDVRWEDFRTSPHVQRSRRSDRIYYLESTAEPPILWLNQGISELATVLESKGTWGRRATIRDLVNQAIAGPVWYGLLHTALMSVSAGEDGTPTVPEGWQRGLLARLAPRLHPGTTREHAYRQLLDELFGLHHGHESDAPELIERLVAAIQDELDLPEMVRRALKDLAKDLAR